MTPATQTVENAIAVHLKAALQVAYRQLGDWETARDVVQDVVVHILEKPQQVQEVANFRAWFIRLVLNRCTDWHRRWQRFRKWQLAQFRFTQEERGVGNNEPADWFQQVLNQLPRKQRMIVILRYQENFSIEEIADMLNISVDTVRVHLMRARRTIRQFLEKENP